MSTDSPHGLQVDQAKRRRANRKGQITKLKNRVQDLRARQPEDYAAESLVDLQEELKTQIAEYNHQQQIIDELIINHSDVLPEDETELDRTEESFIAFKSSLSALIKARLLWDECAALHTGSTTNSPIPAQSLPAFVPLRRNWTPSTPPSLLLPVLSSRPSLHSKIQSWLLKTA